MNPYSKIDQPQVLALLFPSESKEQTPCPEYAEDIIFEPIAGVVLNCRFYFKEKDAPILFLFPATGNSDNSFDLLVESYLQQGINIFLASYRGCGINEGSPSVRAMYADSEKLFHLAIDWLKDRGFSGPLFVMGQSLGSICAIDTVCNNGEMVKGLIVESGICGTSSFLQAIGANLEEVKISEEDGFNTIEKIEKIKTPTLIFHGARDGLVAVAEAENLQSSSGAKTKKFFVIPGAEHHTVGQTGGELYVTTIKEFTDTVCGVNTWRQKRRQHRKKS